MKFFFPNISLCDDGCKIEKIDLKNKTVNCECSFNEIPDNQNNSNFNFIKNVLIENLFGDVLDFFDTSNIAVFKCFKKGFKYFTKSYGSYITLSIIFITLIFSILFFIIGLKKLYIYIYQNTNNYLKFLDIVNEPPLKKKKNEKNKKEINLTTINNKNKKHRNEIHFKNNNINNLNILISYNKKCKNISSIRKDSSFQSSIRLKHNTTKINLEKNKNLSKFNSMINAENKQYKKYFNEYLSTPLEEMDYDDAIRKDNRKFSEYFLDNLKDKQIIINTFITYEPFKPRTIKIILFILYIFLYFVIIALFINDDFISKVYNLEKKENFFSFIPRSIDKFFYATFVSIIIEFIVDFFFVNEKKMKHIFLRKKDNNYNIKKEIIILVKLIKKRFLLFIISIYIIYIICLYYLICFNSIYPHIQIEWIKSSCFIFIIRQIVSIIQCLLETILRFISFKCKSEKLFKTSKLIK